MAITPLTAGALVPGELYEAAARPESRSEAFTKVVRHFLGDVNLQQVQADHNVQRFLSGEADNLNEVMIALSKADLSFRMFMEIRDKVIEAYQEVMRLQL
jgi:flagellar hook-basal body complex protein FliE